MPKISFKNVAPREANLIVPLADLEIWNTFDFVNSFLFNLHFIAFQLLQHTYDAMSCCANEHAFAGYYSEEARKKADEFAVEMASSEIKESEIENKDIEIVNKEREIVDGSDEDNQDGRITIDEPLQEVETIGVDDPIIAADNSRRNRKRKKRSKH